MSSVVQESAAPYGQPLAHAAPTADRRVILHDISWSTYKALSKDLGDSRACRLAFDSGELEIMSPLFQHESSNELFAVIFFVLAEELNLDYVALGSLTCKRDDLMKAIEPDSCFYIANAAKISSNSDRTTIDLSIDPPPDIMVEVDITNSSMNKLSICEALGVPEHWRYDGTRLEIRTLKNGRYVESESAAFKGLSLREALPKFLPLGKRNVLDMSRKFRAWLREELKKAKSPTEKKHVR